MPGNFASIGFQITTGDELDQVFDEIEKDARRVDAEDGYYLCWSSEPGIELWAFIVEPDNSLSELTPYFNGKSSMVVGLTGDIGPATGPNSNMKVTGWANPKDGEPKRGDYPFVFDVADRYIHRSLDYPFISPVKLSAFAEKFTAYDNESDYFDSQTGDPKFAPESFVPSGMFSRNPKSRALISGRVLETSTIRNPHSGDEFVWAHVKIPGGTIDVVCESSLVSAPLKLDGIVSGSFWLCGRILEPRVPQPGTASG